MQDHTGHGIRRALYDYERKEKYAVLYVKQKIDTDMISKIIIGPRNGATEKDVGLLLARNGFSNINVHIGKSEATYRSGFIIEQFTA